MSEKNGPLREWLLKSQSLHLAGESIHCQYVTIQTLSPQHLNNFKPKNLWTGI